MEEVLRHKTKDLDYYLRNDRTYTQAEKEEYKRLKQAENLQTQQDQQWQRGDWEYHWNANGSLKSVKLPDGNLVEYEYDALGRRTKKIFNNKIIRYLWDNNVLLHEWEYNVEEKPRRIVNKLDEVSLDKPEPINNLITWVYETGSFVPCAKLTEQGNYSIISDYIGRPIQAYDNNGNLVWSCDYDIYGNLKNLKGNRSFIPFRQLGQYEDVETGLYYNRFRYYDPNSGVYISKDPISILGGLNVYAYVWDSNSQVDIFGLYEIALGLSPYNEYLAYDLKSVYADGEWFSQKISTQPINAKTFVSEFDNVIKNADKIHFSLDGLDPNKVRNAGLNFEVVNGKLISGNVTNVELNKILNDKSLLDKTKFYQMYNNVFKELDIESVKKAFIKCEK